MIKISTNLFAKNSATVLAKRTNTIVISRTMKSVTPIVKEGAKVAEKALATQASTTIQSTSGNQTSNSGGLSPNVNSSNSDTNVPSMPKSPFDTYDGPLKSMQSLTDKVQHLSPQNMIKNETETTTSFTDDLEVEESTEENIAEHKPIEALRIYAASTSDAIAGLEHHEKTHIHVVIEASNKQLYSTGILTSAKTDKNDNDSSNPNFGKPNYKGENKDQCYMSFRNPRNITDAESEYKEDSQATAYIENKPEVKNFLLMVGEANINENLVHRSRKLEEDPSFFTESGHKSDIEIDKTDFVSHEVVD